MTRQEAEKEAKKLNSIEPKWYCPLIKDMCRKDCINFQMAYPESTEEKSNGMLHDINDDSFVVNGFVCSNAMYIGDFICSGGD